MWQKWNIKNHILCFMPANEFPPVKTRQDMHCVKTVKKSKWENCEPVKVKWLKDQVVLRLGLELVVVGSLPMCLGDSGGKSECFWRTCSGEFNLSKEILPSSFSL